MSKRYREPIEDVETVSPADPAPLAFRWRGRRYTVTQVLGHWREDAGWWRDGDGEPLRIERSDLWRVSARNGHASSPEGVYEVVRRGEQWRLDRVWD